MQVFCGDDVLLILWAFFVGLMLGFTFLGVGDLFIGFVGPFLFCYPH